ncbi:hypothetical protein TRFO_03238 [Tritrichomonas foetus]|uniref:Protein kinase domain-containing protein n=1 Tax=Tritrichomonas foetus TaxID=1144522 RepID=A0A1J4KS98_9EUKA|nr:hypothetical protein TRFO_03238 [Tritrichomonas foetus]|eukprot:OHT14169.1 hypothetical protein TRFO_03238 [Tritrichomonas foetus]
MELTLPYIMGPYYIYQKISKGGFGSVYKASSDRYPDCDFAIKFQSMKEKSSREAYQSEVEALCNLPHPNIIFMYDYGVFDDFGYIVMEYCEMSLYDKLIEIKKMATLNLFLGSKTPYQNFSPNQRDNSPNNYYLESNNKEKNRAEAYRCFNQKKEAMMTSIIPPQKIVNNEISSCGNGLLSVEYGMQIFSQISSALYFIHSKGFVHRDIKPANILINKYGKIKLADFGLAKKVEAGSTIIGCAGTLDYCAPEIIPGKEYDPYSADVWAAGIVFYQCLNGPTLPWVEEGHFDIKDLVGYGFIEFKQRDVPRPVTQIIKSMLAMKPEKRVTSRDMFLNFSLNDTISGYPSHSGGEISLSSSSMTHSGNIKPIKSSGLFHSVCALIDLKKHVSKSLMIRHDA